MREHDGLVITGRGSDEICVACNKNKECLYLESRDGSFHGWTCFNHAKLIFRMRLPDRSRPEGDTPLFDANGSARQAAEA